ncbi:hypothetical protein UT300018_27730 [Clostridium faecium]|uniref:Uncharacterized protein n=1 Tax=Clostridium faecium TaxID=2762223 RepID=A0ABR8YUL3_9CLOT|nr:hypothetical protein [Clostridium faecium]MBD8047968.1 hypothetical protein [Clostridium faecium]
MSKIVLSIREAIVVEYFGKEGSIENIRATLLKDEMVKRVMGNGLMAGVFPNNEIHILQGTNAGKEKQTCIIVSFVPFDLRTEMHECLECRECRNFLDAKVRIVNVKIIEM